MANLLEDKIWADKQIWLAMKTIGFLKWVMILPPFEKSVMKHFLNTMDCVGREAGLGEVLPGLTANNTVQVVLRGVGVKQERRANWPSYTEDTTDTSNNLSP